MALRKIEAMHQRYGRAANPLAKCGGCCNFRRYVYNGRRYNKCVVYGESHSEATDWRVSWPACGQAGIPYVFKEGERQMVYVMVGQRIEPEWKPVDGQIEMMMEE